MGNIDDKTISAILARIESLKGEISLLEEDVKALALPVPQAPVPEPEVVPEPEPVPEPAGTPVEEQAAPVEEPVELVIDDDIPIDISISDMDMPVPEPDFPEPVTEAPSPEPAEPGKAILDTAKADTAVMDVMAEKQAWRTDRPGMPVKNIISAISLNDRVLLINVLFGEDPLLFQEAISRFNSMGSLSEALEYIAENYPGWDMNSEPVYRLMMAVRRKLS